MLVEGIRNPVRPLMEAHATADFGAAVREFVHNVTDRPLLQQELDVVEAEIYGSFPELKRWTRPDPIPIEGIQQDLARETLMLEYASAGSDLYLWAIRSDRIHWARLSTDPSAVANLVVHLVIGYRQHPGGRDVEATLRPSASLREVERATEALSRLLLGTVPPEFFEGVSDLRVFADGPLHYVPFELLQAPGSAQEIVLDRYSVTYAPSLTALMAVAHTWQPADRYDGSFIGFGGVPASRMDDNPGTALEPDDRFMARRLYQFGPLPAAQAEVSDIARDFGPGAIACLGSDATEQEVIRKAPGFRFVHFATHGVAEDGDARFGGLVLSPPRPSERQKDDTLDDFLQVFEMFELRLSAELVVCSACRTGLGKLQEGEGIRGMAHALFSAGARALVLSLWSVPDEATAELMRRLYVHIRSGLPISRALRAAKQELREQPRWRDPYFWAAFVALGPADLPLAPSVTINALGLPRAASDGTPKGDVIDQR
jgi:hypothetical protein